MPHKKNHQDEHQAGAEDEFKDGLDFVKQATTPAHKEGRTFYDDTKKALTVFNDNTAMEHNLGQEIIVRVYNGTGSLISNGAAVYINGANGGDPTVALAQASTTGWEAHAGGLATTDIPAGGYGYVTLYGQVNGIDTSAFTAGTPVYLSPDTAGGMVDSKPNLVTRMGIALDSATDGAIFINPADPIALQSKEVYPKDFLGREDAEFGYFWYETRGRLTAGLYGQNVNNIGFMDAQFRLPNDFKRWKDDGTACIEIETYRLGDVDNYVARLRKGSAIDSVLDGVSVMPSADQTFETFTLDLGDTYQAGDLLIFELEAQVDISEYAETTGVKMIYETV